MSHDFRIPWPSWLALGFTDLSQQNLCCLNWEKNLWTSILFCVMQLKDPNCGRLDMNFFMHNASVANSGIYCNFREVTGRHKLAPGTYCIVPSTFDPGYEGDFVLRVYTEKPISSRYELTQLIVSLIYCPCLAWLIWPTTWCLAVFHRHTSGRFLFFLLLSLLYYWILAARKQYSVKQGSINMYEYKYKINLNYYYYYKLQILFITKIVCK